MPKFFIKTDNIKENEEIHIIGNDVNHLKNVLRKKVDDKITVCNSDTSINYECIIIEIEENEIICKIVNEEESVSESKLNITIFQGLPKADKMELIIQKATELGVKNIVPVNTKRTIVKLKDKDKQNKVSRWQKIAVLYENEERVSIKDEIEKIKNSNKENLEIGIIIGPEGGLDDTEIEKLKLKSNVSVVTLGKRILRTETVALVVSGILMYELGDLN